MAFIPRKGRMFMQILHGQYTWIQKNVFPLMKQPCKKEEIKFDKYCFSNKDSENSQRFKLHFVEWLKIIMNFSWLGFGSPGF